MTAPTAYPLSWPAGQERAAERAPGAARVSMSSAVLQLKDALNLFGLDSGDHVRNILISSNVTLDQSRPADPGVAVYFHWRGRMRCIACDAHGKPEENLRALYDVVDRWRATRLEGFTDPTDDPAMLTLEVA